ncbi:ATPase AAA [Spirochaetia bacterium]|nr:ATPase AAA [Spirochaetia bacterium]GHU92481.1 ATPase AAA [Spirochaetia bacterium]
MDVVELLPKLVKSGLETDKKAFESVILTIIRKIKSEYPEVASEMTKIMAYSSHSGISRSIDMSPLPIDKETRYPLVKVENALEVLDPILNEHTRKQLDDFIDERKMIDQFLKEDIIPPNSLLLNGPPGVGKSYIAKWLSYQLNLPLIVLDLATSISSYLGRSGQNIRYIFDYAKSNNSILFLDELDAIAKRRDDNSDLGELKRLVNVLLKELEMLPYTCIIIGATNYPELLDKAIWRRFDRSLTIPMPEENERKLLLLRHLGPMVQFFGDDTIQYLAKNTKDINAADICKLSEHIKRQIVLNKNESKKIIALTELFKITQLMSRDEKIALCSRLKEEFPHLSQRDIEKITLIPLTSISRYLKSERTQENAGE